jgi:hypothetical protein
MAQHMKGTACLCIPLHSVFLVCTACSCDFFSGPLSAE